MNLILFEQEEIIGGRRVVLSRSDSRALHLKKILKAKAGTSFDAGVVNGKSGTAVVERMDEEETVIVLALGETPPGLHPLTLILGLSRPPTVKKVLKEATALGVERFILCGTENGERSYLQSSALQAAALRSILLEGAQQACCTQLPTVEICGHISRAAELISGSGIDTLRLALDNYEAVMPLSDFWRSRTPAPQSHQNGKFRTVLAVGSERGWTGNERNRLREAGFTLYGLGPRVLRTETASIAGSAICLSGMGIL